MANIIIKNVGPNKMDVIKEYNSLMNVGLKEAKEAVDRLAEGNEIVISMEGADKERINYVIKRFTDIGADVYEDRKNSFAKAIENAEEKPVDDIEGVISERKEFGESELNKVPYKESINKGILDRETTMKKLIDAGKVAKMIEELSVGKSRVSLEINQQKSEAEKIRQYVPKNNRLWIGPIIITGISCGLLLIVGIIWYLSSSKKYKATYLQEHAEENNRNAEKYIAENVAPLEAELNDINNRISELYESGKVAEAVDFVGEDMFSYGCIEDLYDLIKSRRADNLKEALNLYDDSVHKARMEEMQAAIQNASEVAAAETAKQTALAKDIAKSTHQAATAAKATAYHTRRIDRNTRRFR